MIACLLTTHQTLLGRPQHVVGTQILRYIEHIYMVYIHVQSVLRLIHSSDLLRSIAPIFDIAGSEVR
jgi:hypothetical protein